jgi:predicted phosphodiesterase
MTKPVVVVVVSDLHATSKPPGDAAGSWLTTTTPRNPTDHPLVGLRKHLTDLPDEVDLILCAGDICDKADEPALVMAWTDLVSIANDTGARLVATAGNHDLDSRLQHDLDPRGVLYDLEPPFPALDEVSRDEYWAKNYTIIDGPPSHDDPSVRRWRVVTVNSSAFHGYTGAEGPELAHGRVSPRTSRRLQLDLEKRDPAHLNILLVHHHLEQLPHVDLADESKIRDGEQLAALLDATSPWVVIHGHKHRARILFAHGEGSSATIFAAGSMSAYPYGQVAAAGVTNQAYILRFADETVLEEYQLGVACEFTSISWIPDRGWKLANSDFGLPGKGGFGWRADPKSLATKLRKALQTAKATKLSFADMLALEPRLRYLSPAAVDALKMQLERQKPSITLSRTEHGLIESIAIELPITYVESRSSSDED